MERTHETMLKTCQETYLIRSYQADVTDHLRPSALLEMMQEMAGKHADLLRIGRNLLDEMHLAWVLTRVEVRMLRWPKSHETITIETFPMPNRRWFFPRYFIFRDAQGNDIGCAGSLWTLMDVNERKMVSPAQVQHLLPDNRDLTAPMGLPATVDEIASPVTEGRIIPVYTDLDVNGHVNNTKYLDWCCNALGIDIMKSHELNAFALNFHQEILPRQEVRTELHRDGAAFSFSGFEGEKRHFDVGGTLNPRT